jgi:hypothetical protein
VPHSTFFWLSGRGFRLSFFIHILLDGSVVLSHSFAKAANEWGTRRLTTIAAEGDEVQVARLLIALQSPRHERSIHLGLLRSL